MPATQSSTKTAPHIAGSKLTGITNDSGECAHCGRELGKVYEVEHPDGTTATYGRRCCARVTGYKGNRLDAEARTARRLTIIATRESKVAAAFPQFAHLLGAVWAPATTPAEHAVFTAVTSDSLWKGEDEQGGGWAAYANWREYLAENLGTTERTAR